VHLKNNCFLLLNLIWMLKRKSEKKLKQGMSPADRQYKLLFCLQLIELGISFLIYKSRIKYQITVIKCFKQYTTQNTQKWTSVKWSTLYRDYYRWNWSVVHDLILLIFYSFNRRFQPFLNALLLPAVSSLTAMYSLVLSPYLSHVGKFI